MFQVLDSCQEHRNFALDDPHSRGTVKVSAGRILIVIEHLLELGAKIPDRGSQVSRRTVCTAVLGLGRVSNHVEGHRKLPVEGKDLRGQIGMIEIWHPGTEAYAFTSRTCML